MSAEKELEKWQKAAWALSASGMSFRTFLKVYGPKIEEITKTAIARDFKHRRFFVVDYKYGNDPVETKLFDYDNQQDEAEKFCKQVRENGGAVNIRIRGIEQ